MKKIIYNRIYFLQFLCIVAVFALLFACEKDEANPPVISEIRNYDASPNDTIINTLNAGQWVVVLGKNLSDVRQVYFGSIPATINGTFLTNESIVVQVPTIPFQSVPREKLNVVTVVNSSGPASFEIAITGAPIISHVRNYEDNVIAESVVPSQKIKIIGYNLKVATKISFQGVAADLTSVEYPDDSTAIVQVPAVLSGGDASLANTISVTNKLGTGTFAIRIIGPPIITSVSYEFPREGDQVYLYGNNLFSVQSLTFAGATISSYEASADGTSLKFTAPKLTQSGPVAITTKGGQFTTAYTVNDLTTGMIGNMEWGDKFGYAWWGGASLTSGNPSSGWPPYNPDFTGNSSMFLELKNNKLAGGAGDDGVALRLSEMQWLPAESLSDPVGSWVLKFEINVPHAWNGGTVTIKSWKGDYSALWAPWQISPSNTKPYTTQGWQTVAIPLTSFRTNNGTGTSVPNLISLIGNTGKTGLILYVHNYSTAPTETSFDASFDNFRVVKR